MARSREEKGDLLQNMRLCVQVLELGRNRRLGAKHETLCPSLTYDMSYNVRLKESSLLYAYLNDRDRDEFSPMYSNILHSLIFRK